MFASSRISSSSSSDSACASSTSSARDVALRCAGRWSSALQLGSIAVFDAAARSLNSNARARNLDELGPGERRIVQVDALRVLLLLRFERGAYECRLPGPASPTSSVMPRRPEIRTAGCSGLAMFGREEQITRVRGQVERQFAEPVEALYMTRYRSGARRSSRPRSRSTAAADEATAATTQATAPGPGVGGRDISGTTPAPAAKDAAMTSSSVLKRRIAILEQRGEASPRPRPNSEAHQVHPQTVRG